MKSLTGKVCAITGAGSGIGRALALQLTALGAHVALSDVRADLLDQTALLCAGNQGRALTYVVDVRNADAMVQWAGAVVADFGVVNIVLNNAGLTVVGNVEDLSLADIAEVMDVDFWGVVHGSKAFLPYLIDSADGHIVNISSVFGLIGVPAQSAYNAAKFAVRGFTEALRQEMIVAGYPVAVTCVHPGGIATDVLRNARVIGDHDRAELINYFDTRLARTTAEQAAKVIIRGVRREKARVLIGSDAYAIDLAVRVLGSGYQRLVTAAARRGQGRRKPLIGRPPVSPGSNNGVGD